MAAMVPDAGARISSALACNSSSRMRASSYVDSRGAGASSLAASAICAAVNSLICRSRARQLFLRLGEHFLVRGNPLGNGVAAQLNIDVIHAVDGVAFVRLPHNIGLFGEPLQFDFVGVQNRLSLQDRQPHPFHADRAAAGLRQPANRAIGFVDPQLLCHFVEFRLDLHQRFAECFQRHLPHGHRAA